MVHNHMMVDDDYTEIVIVFNGQEDHNYSHAACFVRGPDYKGMYKQLYLLDSANDGVLVYPRKLTDQLNMLDSVRLKDDIVGPYHGWQLYAFHRRAPDDEHEKTYMELR